MKKLVTVFILMLFLTGCAYNNERISTETKAEARELITVPYFSEVSEIQTGVFDFQMDWTESEKEELAPQMQAQINHLCEDMCDFFCTEMGANWICKPIKAYRAEVKENMGPGIDACYYDGKIFIDKQYSEKRLTGKFKYAVAHELVHFLSHSNNGEDARFSVHAYDEAYIGMYLEEAFVDSLTRKYMLSRDAEITTEDMSGGYNGIRALVDNLQLSVPDTFIYFFDNNVEGLKEEVDSVASKRVYCVDSPFEKWASLLDMIYISNNTQELQERLSVALQFMAVNTPATKAADFTGRMEQEGIDGAEVFVPLMY